MVSSATIAQMALAGVGTGNMLDTRHHCDHLSRISVVMAVHADPSRSELVLAQAEDVFNGDHTGRGRLCFPKH